MEVDQHLPNLMAVGTHLNTLDTAQEVSPRLPREIECKIFMLAFRNEQRDVTTLLCVADRVRRWLIPLIYDVIVIDFRVKLEEMLPLLERYGHHVHHLVFGRNLGDSTQSRILGYCPNICDFAYWCAEVISLSAYELTGLKRIAVNDLTRARLDGKIDSLSNMHWFSNITHLIATDVTTLKLAQVFLGFPNLTHFMLVSVTPIEIVQFILRSIPKLEVLVWLLTRVSDEEKVLVVGLDSERALKIDDERVVTIDGRLSLAWVEAAKGEAEHDMWMLAERTIETRRLESL